MFIPSNKIAPSFGSINLNSKFPIVVFPDPLSPTNATISPTLNVRSISSINFLSAKEYETPFNSIIESSFNTETGIF